MDFGISIVVPCYNNWRYIRELVNSIYMCNLNVPYEIIIIDDMSNDRDKPSEFKLEHVRFYCNKRNMGVQETRNKGLHLAKYKYVMMLDADDKLSCKGECFIEYAVNLLEKNDNVAFAHGVVKMFGDFNGYTISAYPVSAELIARKHHVQTSIIYRTIDGIQAGGYSNKIKKWQDWSFGVALLDLRLRQNRGIDIGFLDLISYMYRIHDSDRISNKEIKETEMVEETIKLYPYFFSHFYGEFEIKSLALSLVNIKPTRMIDLMFVAHNNLDRALEIVKERGYHLNSDVILDTIP